MPSILVFGSSKENRNKKIKSILDNIELELNKNNPDLLQIRKLKDKKSIGIKQIRKAITFLTKKPFSHKNKGIIVESADLLTTQAQNALLKTLEEHPKFAYIILSTKTKDSLLTTVISRCKRVRVRELEDIKDIKLNINDLLNEPKGERITRVKKLAKKEDDRLLMILQGWVYQLRKNLDSNNPSITARNIEKINKVLQDLEQTNINTKLALETLFLSLEWNSHTTRYRIDYSFLLK